ncbi:hypothetical protein YA0010_18410 [Pseudomonas syringae]|uniref:hypothetical protein n=1 Tax=Pseudomonas syringae TaxID=317 RepID=UPI00124ADD46|nr:hypothetical protein [Pseudomonas syringae]MBI6849031.1 hypothetical protein [Pseudomonas syringae]
MKLKLETLSVYDADEVESSPMLGVHLSVVFENDSGQVSGSFGATFPHPNPRSLSFEEAEKLAIEHILSRI